jgi:hypothetical protein
MKLAGKLAGSFCFISFVAHLTGVSAQAAGLTFDITYTNAVQNDANFFSIQSAVNYVANEFSSAYSDPITLNFTVDEGTIGLGESLFSGSYYRGSYASLRTALIGDAKTADDATATALANLPVIDPYSRCSTCWYATSAEAKALGLLTNQAAFDGTFTFDNSTGFTYDPNNRGTGGYDFIGVTEHEFSELMGRTQQSNGFGYDILDTMRFTAAGTRNVDLSGVPGVYFSFDNGNTHLAGFNAGGGDKQDLNGAVVSDPFNASTGPNTAHALNAVDFATLDVIGYDRISNTPEPSFFIPAVGLIGFGLLRFRKRAQA